MILVLVLSLNVAIAFLTPHSVTRRPITASAAPAGEITTTLAADAVKQKLLTLCALCDRGFAATSADRADIETVIDELALLNPIQEPARSSSLHRLAIIYIYKRACF